MNKRLLFFMLMLLVWRLGAQPLRYGNEWIDYSLVHYKIKITTDGFYRIPYSTLSAAIPNISSVNPANIALYHNGTQEPIYLSNTTSLGATDFIEFYGRKNIADMDSVLYPKSGWQPHIYKSNFTDTSIYFLVVNNQTNNRRYQQVANDTSLATTLALPEELYFWQVTRQTYTATFTGGKAYQVGTSLIFKSIWDEAEGFGSGWFSNTSPGSVTLTTQKLYTNGPQYGIRRCYIFTRSPEDHWLRLSWNGTPYWQKQFYSWGYNPTVTQVRIDSILASNTIKTEELQPSQGVGNQDLILYADLEYPRKFDFSGTPDFLWRLREGTNPRFFRLQNYATAGVQPMLYDLTNGLMIPSSNALSSTTRTYVIPAVAGEREMFIRSNPNAATSIASMDSVTFRDYRAAAAQSDYIIISNRALFADSLGVNQVEEFRKYRDKTANPATGKFDARTVYDIDQLFDQFGYGIRKTPLAIRNFIEYAYDNWNKKPEYLFIIGKGRDYREILQGGGGQSAAQAYAACLVPTWGRPASDNLLATRRGSNAPLLAVGRLAAQRPEQVRDYLAKVRQYESLQARAGDPYQTKAEKDWMKQVMHFGGGETSIEQAELASYIDDWTTRIQDTSWGTHVTSYYKTSSAPIDVTQKEAIAQRRDSGVALMSLFGHSAGTATDIDIDQPENWTNYERYPIIYSNGCFAGSIHDAISASQPSTFSERFVLTPGKGAIIFTATSGSSISGNLYNYGTFVYDRLRSSAYNTSWGKALQAAYRDNDSIFGSSDFDMFINYEMTLHGDPAVKLYQYPKPDYQIDNESVYFTPTTIDAASDSFLVNIIVANLGRAIKDSIEITLTRKIDTTGNGTGTNAQFIYKKMVRATYYRDTFSFKLPTLYNRSYGYGPNDFQVFVESKTRIDEMSETNNGSLELFSTYIQSDDVIPIWPYEFAIVPKQNPVLKASTVNIFAPERTYRFQLDTSERFQTILAQGTVTQKGGVLHWTVPVSFSDSTVYYWRVGTDSAGGLTKGWKYSSFLYLKDEYPGWNQSHYYQWKKDNYSEEIYLDSDRVFKYNSGLNSMYAMAGWSNATGGQLPAANLEWQLNGVNQHRYRMGSCGFALNGTNGITFGVVDTNNLEIWESVNTGTNFGRFGNYHCASQTLNQSGFDFHFDNTTHPSLGIPWAQVVSNFLDSIPNGAYVVMYSDNRPNWSTMPATLKNKLIGFGASLLQLYVDSNRAAPYIFFFQKGVPGNSKQIIGTDYNTAISSSFDFRVKRQSGTYESTLIGPANEWGSVHWRYRRAENTAVDQQYVEIIGVRQNGTQNVLLQTTTLDTTLNFVNAAQYPFVRLRMYTRDDSTHTPSQNYYWRVLYKEVPEAAMNPTAYFKIQRDTIGIGDSVNVGIALENVSTYNMDSMRTKYVLQSLQNQSQQSFIIKQDSLYALDTMILQFRQPLLNSVYEGKNRLSIEANPIDTKHQPERFHFNNFAFIDFNAVGDKINPLLDVTFDGQHIMNGDIVSAKPNILISLRDENKNQALKDTSLMQVYIKYPGVSQPVYFPYDGNVLSFYPASGDISKMNKAKIELKPAFTVDGTYELLVKDRDNNGNSSGVSSNQYVGNVHYDYRTTFEIITKPMVSSVLNYPNPFSTSTRFDFTLTGSEVPTYLKIQIMTITGRVVKEITKEELGDIHIGHNLTRYAWDGRDQYGDKLANGVYFYRVISNLDGRQMDHMNSNGNTARFFNNTNIDKYFKQGFGKLVILR
ncbi:MAG: C25 family cysteine peptidase [Chitinophagales bacterium]